MITVNTETGVYTVTCDQLGCLLNRKVATVQHAHNLEAKHNRDEHPTDDLTDLVEILRRPHHDTVEQAQSILAAGYVRPPM